ncbi:undecaprenyl-phosphate alpha-N-acetylglucosaminyl 1-phosphate transferase [Photobacterium aphoticum]|nr:undecaprenyl-phosphate alpha-N-acetylglucosaminyl 1-phosphate transferase [Photobacterium aphoticum]
MVPTPLVGGIAVWLTLTQYFYYKNLFEHTDLFLLCISLLTLIGALDDKFEIRASIRMVIQAALSVGMMYFAQIELHTLGNMFGTGEIFLGNWGYIITILAVIGAINAFNMVDGIDGLLGGLSMISFSSLAIILYFDNQTSLAYALLIVVVAILPYVMFNLGWLGKKRKVFMGDAGSMLIGFTIIWMLLLASQNDSVSPLRPVTALWLIAIPLMDMAAIITRRVKRGVSPFSPDREHLHHLFQKIGLNANQTLITINGLAIAFAGFGMYGEYAQTPEYIMFALFIISYCIYSFALAKLSHFISFQHADKF